MDAGAVEGLHKTVTVFHSSPEGDIIGVAILTGYFHKEGAQWVGTCLELGTSAYGTSLEEADEQLLEAILLQLNEVERLGVIEDYLQKNNVPFRPVHKIRVEDRQDSWHPFATIASSKS